MKPWELLGRTATPEGDELTLMRRSGELVIFANGKPLMSSRMHGSEDDLATIGCRRARLLPAPCVLVGGLGGALETGRALDYLPAGDDNRKLCSLYLGIMDRFGVKLNTFGDADTRLVNF